MAVMKPLIVSCRNSASPMAGWCTPSGRCFMIGRAFTAFSAVPRLARFRSAWTETRRSRP